MTGDDDRVRVLLHFAVEERLRESLTSQLGDLDVVWCAEDDGERLAELLPEVDVWWHVLRPVTAEDLDRAPRLRLIQKLGSGVDTIDLDAAAERGVWVSNMVGMNAAAVAEATLGLMLAALRQSLPLHVLTTQGDGWGPQRFVGAASPELGESTVGLVGHGEIARRVEAALLALGARVVHTTSRPTDDPGWRPLEQLLAESDVVSLHLPLTAETRHLLDRGRIALMRPGVVLVNTARGGLVDQQALLAALRSGHVRAAGLDVLAQEPPSADDPVLRTPGLVLSPHVAWLTSPSLRRSLTFAADNVRRLRAGEPPLRVVVPGRVTGFAARQPLDTGRRA